MATISEEFLQKFSNLEGVTIAERKKNFFKLLHQVAPLLKPNTEHQDLICANLKTNSLLEDLFKVDFLIYFRRTSELLQLLSEGNSVIISKVAKQSWFFTEAFNNVSADQLVNEILPCMSYSIRMKILRKLSRYTSCEKFEQIYDALAARYGIYLASQFITGCGPDKVRQILLECPIELKSTQLRILYDKDPELIDFYFIHSKHTLTNDKYKSFVKFIFDKHRDYYDRLNQKHSLNMKFGRRTTKKFVVANKDAIIKKTTEFSYLDMKAVFRKIGKDSVKLYTNLLPDKVDGKYKPSPIFNYFPKKYYYSMFFKVYQTHYNIKFEDHPDLIDKNLLKMIPNNSERAHLAKVKVNEGNDYYLKYLLIDESVPLIKKKINVMSDIQQRRGLISDLVETCHINNDLTALFSTLKYFCHRHKNEDLNVHLEFIDEIEERFGFQNFTEEMWTHWNELLMIINLKYNKNEAIQRKISTLSLMGLDLGTTANQKLSYLQFLFKKGEQIDELIREYFTTNSEYPNYGSYEKNFEKHFLLFVINNLAKQSNEKEDLDFNFLVFSEISKWNRNYKDDQLSFYDFPAMLYTYSHVIRNYDNNNGSHVEFVQAFRCKIFTTQQNTHRDQYLQVYWQDVDKFLNFTDIKWFLKYEPLSIVANFEKVFHKLNEPVPKVKQPRRRRYYRRSFRRYGIKQNESVSKTNKSGLWYLIKKFRYLHLDEKFIETCLVKLREEDPSLVKAKYIPCLSVLMTPSEYVALADSYKPENIKLDVKNEKEVVLYNLQCAIATGFKNTKNYEVLSSLLNYCAGDFLKYALPALYSLLYRTPENKLLHYLNYLSQKAVSVRKHALFMMCELSTSKNVEDMLRLLSTQEGVLSSQKHMFSATIKYFLKNPTDSIFELVKLNMLFIAEEDDESLSSIIGYVDQIPQKYKARYILHAWEHFEKTMTRRWKLNSHKTSFLSTMAEETMKEIPLEWGLRIIHQHYRKDSDDRLPGLTRFLFKFLNVKEEKSVIFEAIFTLLNQSDDENQFKYFDSWYEQIMTSKYDDLKYLIPFVNYFEPKITPVEKFCDYIKVFFLKLKVEYARSLPVEELALKVLDFFDRVCADLGQHVSHLFGKEMDSCLCHFQVDHSMFANSVKYLIYDSMIKQRPVPVVAVLLINVITVPSNSYAFDDKRNFANILKQIKKIDDVGVQINLEYKFKEYFSASFWRLEMFDYLGC